MDDEEQEYSTEYGIADILKVLPDDLSEELNLFIRENSLNLLDELDTAIGHLGQIPQLVVLTEYNILQFGVLLTVLKENDLVLADDSKAVLARTGDFLRLLAGHIDLLVAPKTRH